MDEREEIIASRKITNKTDSTDLKIILYKPVKENDNVWACSFKVGGMELKSHGEDSMQALILSIDAIRRTLDKITDELYWIEDSKFLGFPLFVPMYLPDNEIHEVEKKLLDIEKELIECRAKNNQKEK